MKVREDHCWRRCWPLFSGQACAVGGMADVYVYDRSEGGGLPVYWHEGRAYVVGKPGNEYQMRVRSRQGEDVLAVVSVDGVNVITGETARRQQTGYVPRAVPAAGRARLAQEPGRRRRSTSPRCRIPMPRAPGGRTTWA